MVTQYCTVIVIEPLDEAVLRQTIEVVEPPSPALVLQFPLGPRVVNARVQLVNETALVKAMVRNPALPARGLQLLLGPIFGEGRHLRFF